MIKDYARVSSLSQNLERQIVALREAGCEIIYQDKASGKDLNRPEYQKMDRENYYTERNGMTL